MDCEDVKNGGVIFPQNAMTLDPATKNYSNCDIEGSFYTVEEPNADKKPLNVVVNSVAKK